MNTTTQDIRTDREHVEHTTDPRSVPDLLRDLVNQISNLVRSEIRLAQAEVGEKTSQLSTGLISIASGFILGLAALIILLDAVVYGLSQSMPIWLAAVITGGVVAVIGLALVMKGKSDLKAKNLMPERTVRSVQDDAKFAQDQTRKG